MITERPLTPEDYSTIELSLAGDEYHKTTKPDFFYEVGSACKVYEDSGHPVMFVRGVKALRIDIQFTDNHDFERNRKVMTEEFPTFVKRCRELGFKEIVFNTSSPHLRRFCKSVLKFKKVEGDELRFIL